MCGIWDLSSPTRDRACAPVLGVPGKSLFLLLISLITSKIEHFNIFIGHLLSLPLEQEEYRISLRHFVTPRKQESYYKPLEVCRKDSEPN